MPKIQIIGDDIYVGSEKVGTIDIPSGTLRDRFVAAIDNKPLPTKLYNAKE